jgi:hypothetical protein
MDKVDKIKSELEAARSALQAAQRHLDGRRSSVAVLERELHVALSEVAEDHPLTGKRVWKEVRKRDGGSQFRPTFTKYILHGIVETYRNQDVYLSGLSPVIGEALVRHLKTDGTPGKKATRYEWGQWNLEEGEA